MLNLLGTSHHSCDGIARRRFLSIGSLGILGLTLDQLLAGEQSTTQTMSTGIGNKRSVILIWQHGGPSQLDTFDMKPNAPSEVRGPYKSISTSLPGVRISEKLPYHAKVMDKVSIIRSFTHPNNDHFAAAHWMLTGFRGATGADRVPRNPSMGSIAASLLGSRCPSVPAYVNFNDGGFGFHGAAFLGPGYHPVRIGSYSYGNEGIQYPAVREANLNLLEGLTDDRIESRLSLANGFDRLRRKVDEAPAANALNRYSREAVDIVMSGRTRTALDLEKEDAKTRKRYGDGWGSQALIARRLIEAGVRFVTLNTGYWDDHGNLENALNDKLPRHDRAVGVLIADLAERGMLDDTLVITAGEFGRTPVINKEAGRDHWAPAQSILVAGGGYRHGQMIGNTNARAAYPVDRPIGPEDFCAMIYHALQLDPAHLTINLPDGRPIHLAKAGTVPRELL